MKGTGRAARAAVFDLDGTLYQSDDLYRRFAFVLASGMGERPRQEYLRLVERFLAQAEAPEGIAAPSDWSMVARLAEPHLPADSTLRSSLLDVAYRQARTDLLSGVLPIGVPACLPDLLSALRADGTVRVGVVTNGPEEEAKALLGRLGLAQRVDGVVARAGKPEGLAAAVRTVCATGLSGMPGDVVSVGDNWDNDIVPALREGWLTGYVAARVPRRMPSTWQAPTLDGLAAHLLAWRARGFPTDLCSGSQT